MSSAPCGTYGGYQQHKIRREETCAACRLANANYIRDLRASNPRIRIRGRMQNDAYQRAQARLREAHRAEFDAIYEAELRVTGLAS